jgi:shikimate kinase
MGSGKSTIGRRLAKRLGLQFVDADEEVEKAAGCSIEDIFAFHGEQAFRDGEHRVIRRLLHGPAHVLATGGGAFLDERTRETVSEHGISVWLRADIEVLLRRVRRNDSRPLLRKGDPKEILEQLKQDRDPIYALADLAVDSGDGAAEAVVEDILGMLRERAEMGTKEADKVSP